MRIWPRTLIATALLSGAVVLAAASPSAQALPAFSGRIVAAGTGSPLAGVVVHLTDTAGVDIPGLQAVTPANGQFTIPAAGDEYGMRIDGSAVGYEVGYRACVGSPVTLSWGDACTFAPDALGDIALQSWKYSGFVVDSVTGRGLVGAVVRLTDTNGVPIPGKSVVTGTGGKFSIIGLSEEHGVQIDGLAIVHEVGYLAYDNSVVPSWGASATFGPGQLGRIRLDLVAPAPPKSVSLSSPSIGSIRALFVAPPTGGVPTTYRLTCGRVTRTYTASGQVRGGFTPGPNTCYLSSANAAGRSSTVIVNVVVRGALIP